MKNYILAIDQGTSSCRSILFNLEGNIVGQAQQEFKQYYPKAGWVEHDPQEIWTKQQEVSRQVLKQNNISAEEVAAIGIANQRETVVAWDKTTGQPLAPAIVWQDRRTTDRCEDLKKQGWQNSIHESTGLIIDPYFSGSKIEWLLNHNTAVKKAFKENKLLVGTIDSWLVWKLTAGEAHVTDYTNASRTMLYNIRKKEWDHKLLELFGIPGNILPKVINSAELVGETHPSFLGSKIPIAGIAGDQQAAAYGQLCFQKGMVKNTYGTGCFMLMNVGNEFIASKNGLLTTLMCDANGKACYGLEGSIFIAGAAIQWLRDELGFIQTAAESQDLAEDLKHNDGVYFVPAFSGLGTPYWNMEARGLISGLTRGTTQKHIVRAALEAIAYQSKDVLHAMENDAELKLSALRVDGGALANDFLMQFQADILNIAIQRPTIIETTAQGAAYLAGLSTGKWKAGDLEEKYRGEKTFSPMMSEENRTLLYKGWKQAIQRTLS